ncbi:NAD(P)/FAD-dependent oxidoreductase [Ruegeria arenilitoris]|uniref:NAD(P)/FAD-dependent oxidoreductase n=1 Tax=Ruegeria arenilitoris TaxID=1173585 RepID=UPI001C2BAB81|nr:FAD-dependent monooxygenase [Ruegeria arenilitoris]
MNMRHETFDAIVVGARVAGAATAMLLARGGARVLLVDSADRIGDTMSTHALMRPAVTLLDRWGLAERLVSEGTAVVTRTSFQYGRERIEIPMKPVGALPGLISPRRWLLDPMLLEAAVAAGADLRLSTAFEGVTTGPDGTVTGAILRNRLGQSQTVRCRLLVGADGRLSRVAAAVSAAMLEVTPRGAATIYGYVDGLPNEGNRWMFSPGLQAGLIPTTAGLHCVFASCPQGDFRARFAPDALAGLVAAIAVTDQEVAAHIACTGPVERLTRFAGAPGHIRAAAGKGWALVGDAGYFKDPATAHGISDALLDAHRLAAAVFGAGLRAYVQSRNAHGFEFLQLTAKIGAMDWPLDVLKVHHQRLSSIINAESAELADTADLRAAA